MIQKYDNLQQSIFAYWDRVSQLDSHSESAGNAPEADNSDLQEQPSPTIEEQLITILLHRDAIQGAMEDKSNELNGIALKQLIDTDFELLTFFKKNSLYSEQLKLWRNHYQVIPDNHWWWFSDEYIFSTSDGIQHEARYTGLFLLSVFFIIASIFLTAYTAQGLFQRELNLEAIITVGANLLWGGVLASPQGSSIARQFLQRLITRPEPDGIPRVAPTGNLAFVTFSGLVLLFSLVFTFVILPLAADTTFNWGNNAFDEGDYDTALDWYTLSSKLVPRNFIGRQPEVAVQLTQLGNTYEGLGAKDAAITAYEGALEFDGRIVLAQIPLADLYVDAGRLDEALVLSDRSLNSFNMIDDDDFSSDSRSIFMMRARVIRARILLNLGFVESAINNLEMAMEEDGFQIDIQNYYVITAYRLLAFARVARFAELELTGDLCTDEINSIKQEILLPFREEIRPVTVRPPYDLWEADLLAINTWLNTYNCTEPSGGNEAWSTLENY